MELARGGQKHFLRGILGIDSGAAEAQRLTADKREVRTVQGYELNRR
jgi:hypothetical protein